MLTLLFQFLLGLCYANAGEWMFHRCILHGVGKNPQSFWAYHIHEHHIVCLRNKMLDPGYQTIDFTCLNTQTKELLFLVVLVFLHLPIFYVFPFFVAAVYFSLLLYYYKHRKSHVDPVWAWKHLRWHYEHHLGGNPNANWCVTWPWFDYLCGTRRKSEEQK